MNDSTDFTEMERRRAWDAEQLTGPREVPGRPPKPGEPSGLWRVAYPGLAATEYDTEGIERAYHELYEAECRS